MDVQVKNSSGTVLASSPTISKREVRTYVSVANNTHFILGGLIAKATQRPIADGLRHSGITYRLLSVKHDGEVALWAGNSPQMIHDHYKGLKTNREGEEYWAILPPEA